MPDVVAVSGDSLKSSIMLSVFYDRNVPDKYQVLYKGYSVSASYELAGVGGDVHYNKWTLSGNWQTTLLDFPTDHKWVIYLGAVLGYMTRFSDRQTPIFDRFFIGGPQSVRGFQYRGVGPMVNDKPTGGDVRITGTAELSFPLFLHILRGVVFLDAGDVESSPRDVHGTSFRAAAGVGARIKLPIFPAPIALDFAWPLIRQRDDKPQVFSFSVGVGF
ncbi:BamA/TamA family outer membrane protein [bacterium]|nr:BamA/TamA family outer membrane protein [bacterium]